LQPVNTRPNPGDVVHDRPADPGQRYTTTSCPDITTGPTPVASCSYIAPTALNKLDRDELQHDQHRSGAGGDLPSAAAMNPTAANNYTTGSCPSVVTGPSPVSSCTQQTAAAGKTSSTSPA
jgi:hypothetical protein